MITSRERVNLALQHKEADRIPLDLGGTMVTGMHVSTVSKLRQTGHFNSCSRSRPGLQGLRHRHQAHLKLRGEFAP